MMSLFTRLFGRLRRDKGQQRFVVAQRRVLDYARYLETYPPLPGRIRDSAALPHDKSALKQSLMMCIGHSTDERLREHLKAGYLMLSAFQRGVGEKELGTDFTALDLADDPLTIATRIEGDALRAQQWQTQVENELESLRDDLEALELALAEPLRLSA